MRTLKNKSLRKFSDKELLSRLEKLGAKERETMLTILIYLIEIERRSLYLKQGYSSLFEFCVSYLRYSESAAARRIRVARCMRDFPEIYTMLLRGDLNLDTVSKAAGIVTRENKNTLLREISGRSSRDVDMIISRYDPKRSPRDRVRPIYVMTEAEGSDKKFTAGAGSKKVDTFAGSPGKKRSYEGETGGQSVSMSMPGSDACGGGVDESVPRVKLEQKFKLEFAVDPEFMATLERLKALLSNKYPEGLDFERLFKILMDDYLDRHSHEGRIKRRLGRNAKAKKLNKKGQAKRAEPRAQNRDTKTPAQVKHARPRAQNIHTGTPVRAEGTKPRAQNINTKTPAQAKRARSQSQAKATVRGHNNKNSSAASSSPSARSNGSRYIPQSIRDKVFTRDGGRCTYTSTDGKRCTADKYLQMDHIIPFAKGGDNSPDNLRLLCARHNNLMAERAYGKKFMNRFHRRE